MSSTLRVWPSLAEDADGLFLGQDEPLDGDVLAGQLPHPDLDRGQVFDGEGLVPEKVVEEAVVHGRADPGLRPREEVEDGVGQQVGGAVAEDFEIVRRGGFLLLFFLFFHLKYSKNSKEHYREPIPPWQSW